MVFSIPIFIVLKTLFKNIPVIIHLRTHLNKCINIQYAKPFNSNQIILNKCINIQYGKPFNSNQIILNKCINIQYAKPFNSNQIILNKCINIQYAKPFNSNQIILNESKSPHCRTNPTIEGVPQIWRSRLK